MIPTIPIMDIVKKWRDAIKGNAAIESFCQDKYGKSLTLYVGLDGKDAPKDADCPYCILFPGEKNEGLSVSTFDYTLTIGWGIVNKTKTVENNVVEYAGPAEVDALGQLIYSTLAALNPAYPVTAINYSIETYKFFPQFVGSMELTVEVPVTMGTSLSY